MANLAGRALHRALRPVNSLVDRLDHRYSFPEGISRIYCFHVRKTGGTSLHRSVMSLRGEDPEVVHRRIAASRRRRTRTGDLILQAHSLTELQAGHYSYGWSHRPAYVIALPPQSYTLTILRDPVDRVVSHYKMLRDDSTFRYPFPPPESEIAWARDGWSSFLRRIPREHLFRQLYMFSPTGNVDEATSALTACSLVLRLEKMQEGLETLSQLFGSPMGVRWERRSAPVADVGPRERAELRCIMEPEYRLLENLNLGVPESACE